MLAVGGAMLAVGLGLIGWSAWSARRADATQSWDTAPGTLLHHEIVEVRGRYGARNHLLRVRYSYAVAGTTYESTRLCYGAPVWESLSEIQLWLDENVRDGRVEVFHDPRRPSASVLLPGRAGAGGVAIVMVIGALLSMVGGAITGRELDLF